MRIEDIYLFIYLLTNAHENYKHNASHVKMYESDDGLQEWSFITAITANHKFEYNIIKRTKDIVETQL